MSSTVVGPRGGEGNGGGGGGGGGGGLRRRPAAAAEQSPPVPQDNFACLVCHQPTNGLVE